MSDVSLDGFFLHVMKSQDKTVVGSGFLDLLTDFRFGQVAGGVGCGYSPFETYTMWEKLTAGRPEES